VNIAVQQHIATARIDAADAAVATLIAIATHTTIAITTTIAATASIAAPRVCAPSHDSSSRSLVRHDDNGRQAATPTDAVATIGISD
jgi:hypothetical protein